MDERDRDVKQWCFDRVSFLAWSNSSNGDNAREVAYMKKAVGVILRDYVTDRQKTYILDMFVNGMSVSQVAEKHNVDKSTVSRTIHRGLKNIHSYLRFVSPALIDVPLQDVFLCKRVYG